MDCGRVSWKAVISSPTSTLRSRVGPATRPATRSIRWAVGSGSTWDEPFLAGVQSYPDPLQLLDALGAAGAVATLPVILEITDRGQGGNWPVAALVTAFYGATYFFWYYAVTTEQYTSAVVWTLAGIVLAFRWERARQDRSLLLLALLVGIGLAHMVTVLFLVPPLLWFLLSAEPRLLRRPRLVAGAIGLILLPLLSYAFVYFAGAAHPEWQAPGPGPAHGSGLELSLDPPGPR